MLRSHSFSRCRATLTPCTPMLAITPPGAMICSQSSKVAGMPTASMAVSTPRLPVSFIKRLDRLAVAAVDGLRRAEALGDLQAVVVEVDHDDLARRIELGGQQGGQTDRSGADDGHGGAGLDLAVEHAAFEAGRQDVAEHHQRLFVGAFGDGIEAGVGVRGADELGLGAVDGVAEDPAAGRAMGEHALAAVLAFAAGADAGDQHPVAGLEGGDGRPDAVDDADALVAEDAAGRAARQVAFEDVQVGAADGGLGDPDDGVGRVDRSPVWRGPPRPSCRGRDRREPSSSTAWSSHSLPIPRGGRELGARR